MTDRMSLVDFFAMEAGEYLERLDALVSPVARPNSDELVRLTRALRGSALMARQTAIADAAGGLEHLARGVREERLSWDEATKQLAVRAVDDLKVFVRKVGDWTEADETKARELAAELDRAAGRTTAMQPAPTTEELDSGTRAFIGREGAAIASALDQAAKALQQNPVGYDPLHGVLTVMQPLRGLAMLAQLAPMPDLLDGIERAVGEITRRAAPTEGAALLFNAAAKAVSRAAQKIATDGTADPDSPEAQDFARRLGAILETDTDLVPIAALYFDDAGPHIVEQGTAPARPRELGRLALVSHGEHLRLAADELERAQSATQRELRAQALAGTFRTLSSEAGGPLEDAVAGFAAAAREAVARGVAVHRSHEFAQQLREAGVILAATGQQDEQVIAGGLRAIASAISAIQALEGPAEPAATAAAPAGGALSRPPADSVATATPPETTAPTAPSAPSAPGAAGAPVAADETPDLAGAWARYERYVAALGLGEPSLEALLAGPPADPAAAPAVAAAPTAPAAPAAEETAELAAQVVPIASLCYSGGAALERALSLRQRVSAALRAGDTDGSTLDDLLAEIFDLVELGRTQQA